MKEQIEEMANVIQHSFQMLLPHDMALVSAEYLCNEGYRKQEWISVEDRLPEESVDVLVVVKIGNRVSVDTDRIYGGKWFNYGKLGHLQGYVTHWMPLPEPPKTKGGVE